MGRILAFKGIVLRDVDEFFSVFIFLLLFLFLKLALKGQCHHKCIQFKIPDI
jgi:hypothetical protein